MAAKADITASLDELSSRLAGRPEVRFAIVFGSALGLGRPHDLDIAVMVDRTLVPRGTDMRYEVQLAAELDSAVPVPVDVRVINDAPLPFRFNVSRGRPVAARDGAALAEFLERTWDEYLDFAPVARQYLLDLA